MALIKSSCRKKTMNRKFNKRTFYKAKLGSNPVRLPGDLIAGSSVSRHNHTILTNNVPGTLKFRA